MSDEEKIEQEINCFEADAKAAITRKNITYKLKKHLKEKYNKEELTNSILKEQGIDPKRFNILANIENFMLEKIADTSVDPNSNKNEVNSEAIIQEAFNPIRKLYGADILYREMKSMYGKEEADKLSMLMYDYSLYLADSTKVERVYCWAMSTNFLVQEGRDFGVAPSTPARRLDSYIGAVCEMLHQLSNHTAGAIALSTLFIDCTSILMSYKGILGEPISYEDMCNDSVIRKRVENEMQSLIYSLNFLSRSGCEPPFSNVTLSDDIKLAKMAEDYQYQFVKPDGSEFSIDEIVKYTLEVQKLYVKVFNAGNLSQGGMQFRFPVTTCAFTKLSNGEVAETSWFRWMLDNADMTRYNIFISEGDKQCSCCRLINDGELLKQGSQISSLGNVTVSMGSIRVVTVNFMRPALMASNIEEFWKIFDENIHSTAKILKAHRSLIQRLTDAGLQPFMNKIFSMDRLFSTFGCAGIVECAETLKKKFNLEGDVMRDLLSFFKEKSNTYSRELNFPNNSEFVPGETLCWKLSKVDALIFGKENQPYMMYSNQFVPLWKKASIYERLEEAGAYDLLFSGGAITHAQINEKISKKQAEHIIKFAAKCNNQHFAINTIMTYCVNNHYTQGKHDKCPECGGDVKDYYTRIVGYFIPISAANKVRREWEFPRRTFVDVPEIE